VCFFFEIKDKAIKVITTRMQAVNNNNNESCCICLEEMKTEISVAMPCTHSFCSPCLKKWIVQKENCPLCCEKIMTINIMKNGELSNTLAASEGSKCAVATYKENFDCCDHSYFKKEYEKLGKKANDLEFTIRADTSNKYYDSASWGALTNLKHDISCKQKMMRELKKFDPKYMLEDVVTLEATITKIKLGEFESYSKDDGYDDYYDEEEVYYYEGYEDGDEDIDLDLAICLKKNNINLAKLQKKACNVSAVSNKKKKAKKEIKV
jgi:hypothetical protein